MDEGRERGKQGQKKRRIMGQKNGVAPFSSDKRREWNNKAGG